MAILLLDIGNTSTKVGLAHREGLLTTYTLRTDAGQTADSLGLALCSLLQHAEKMHLVSIWERIEACVCSSVVPAMTPLVLEACGRFVGGAFYVVPDDILVPLHNNYNKPTEVGADRLVGAYAARTLVPDCTSLIVVDFGTATTFDCITNDAYLGGLIFPGMQTATAALNANTAKLPRVNLECDEEQPVPGRDTASSIKHGIIFGYVSLVEGLTARLAAQLEGSVSIVATGGFAPNIDKRTNCFHKILPDLVLVGLHKLYYGKKEESLLNKCIVP